MLLLNSRIHLGSYLGLNHICPLYEAWVCATPHPCTTILLNNWYHLSQPDSNATLHEISVEVVTSPDLTQAPFRLATDGLSGHERVAEVGGPPNLAPTPRIDRKYSLLIRNGHADGKAGRLRIHVRSRRKTLPRYRRQLGTDTQLELRGPRFDEFVLLCLTRRPQPLYAHKKPFSRFRSHGAYLW